MKPLLFLILLFSSIGHAQSERPLSRTSRGVTISPTPASGSTMAAQVMEVCCEIRASFDGRGKDPGPRNGSSFERSGERGSANRHEQHHSDRPTPGNVGGSNNQGGNSSAPTKQDQSRDPNPPLISLEQIREQIKNAPPTAITTEAMNELQAALEAINNVGKIMTAAQLQDLITKDPMKALKTIIEFLNEDKVGEITTNLRNLYDIKLQVVIDRSLKAALALNDASQATENAFEKERIHRDRIMWENMAEKADKALTMPSTIQKLGLPHLREIPTVKVIPCKISRQGDDRYSLDFSVNDVFFVDAAGSRAKATLVTQYSRDSGFSTIDRTDSVVRNFEVGRWKVAKHYGWLVCNIPFDELWPEQDRFGKFFIRTKIIYEIDEMDAVQSKWSVLNYGFGITKFKVYRQPRAAVFGAR